MSAVLVKMPPPALANSAREEAPKEKPRRIEALPVTISTAATPKREQPTTKSPMTAPPRKPIRKAGLIPFWAASAVRPLERVATRMPILPAMADRTVPAM